MEKLVSTTFKIIFISILFSFLLDTSLLLVQIIGVHTKVSNLTGIMQTEISRNNYMPGNMADAFNAFFDEIVDNNPRIMKDNSIQPNFGELTESDAKDYGEIQNLRIDVYLYPIFGYLNKNITADGQGWFERSASSFDMHLVYEYKVPCLRYLK